MGSERLETDVVIVGAGNAAACAALSAHEHGARVLVIEAAPEAESRRQQPLHRRRVPLVYDGVEDFRRLMPGPDG